MKKLIITLFILGIATDLKAQENIKWVSFNQALELQKKNPKKIFMDVYTDWCGPCKMLDKLTFHNVDVVKYVNENYYAVKFNAEGKEEISYQGNTFTNPKYVEGRTGRNGVHDFTLALQVNAYPTMLFFDESGTPIHSVKSFLKPKQLEIYLKLFAQDDHKEIDTTEKWQEYQLHFKSTFVE